ncbi:MAG: chromate efflux transporter [Candidatus Cohnella colombiensis]|uniref:Chromate efflux transporter n=1 Tax=Candidatus Cohnella colombiensis TaxID=3121368 RepID=A0AA95JHF9_9BACL|nr:MAG: chromate efflux transporter [Cohnella sp.]
MKTSSSIRNLLDVLIVSCKLGITSFGGPIAHLGYFHNEYVQKRKWMDERSYADLVALCQFLPGPASSQVGIGIGVMRAGLLGGVIAWLGFTLPSAIALVLFALLMTGFDVSNAGWIHGLKIVAVAIVAQAVIGMGRKLTPDFKRMSLALAAAALMLVWQTAFSQIAVIIGAGLIGWWAYRGKVEQQPSKLVVSIKPKFAGFCLVIFFSLLIFLPLLSNLFDLKWLSLFDQFYRSGSLVFGGGHVVLPLLEHEMLNAGWMSKESFLAGYGATQAVPGPLFTFAAYLGTVAMGVVGGIVAIIAIFLPAFLLVIGVLPFWNTLRQSPHIQGALKGINAAVVGILLAALYDPLWTTAITTPSAFGLAVLLFIVLVLLKWAPWIVVVLAATGGMFI